MNTYMTLCFEKDGKMLCNVRSFYMGENIFSALKDYPYLTGARAHGTEKSAMLYMAEFNKEMEEQNRLLDWRELSNIPKATPVSEPYYHNICTYTNAYDLVYENTNAEEWDSLSEDEQYNLKHLTDWEYQRYIVINNDEVISTDDLNGDVIYREPIAEFIRNAITAAREEN